MGKLVKGRLFYKTPREVPYSIDVSELVRKEHVSPIKISSQVDCDRVQRNIDLFVEIFSKAAHLYEKLKIHKCNADTLKEISDIINLITRFGADGGIGRSKELNDDLSLIVNSLGALNQFIRQEIRKLTVFEIQLISEELFPVIVHLYDLAEIYARTMFIQTKNRSITFSSVLILLPQQQQLKVFKTLFDSALVAKYGRFEMQNLQHFVRPFDQELYWHLIPKYEVLLTSENLPVHEKLSILEVIWVQLYENIKTKNRLLSTPKLEQLGERLTSGAFALIRHVIVHHLEHEQLHMEWMKLMGLAQQEELLFIGASILRELHQTLNEHLVYDKSGMEALLVSLDVFFEKHMKHAISPCPATADFNNLLQLDLNWSSRFDSELEYLIEQLKTIYKEYKVFYEQLTKKELEQLRFSQSLLYLAQPMQEKYFQLYRHIQHLGSCYTALLKSEVLRQLNQLASAYGTLDCFPSDIPILRECSVDYVVVRNEAIHNGNVYALVDLAVKIYEEGDNVIELINEVHEEMGANPSSYNMK